MSFEKYLLNRSFWQCGHKHIKVTKVCIPVRLQNLGDLGHGILLRPGAST